MPIAKFEMPDGRIARFEVPEGTSAEDAQAMMEQSISEMTAQSGGEERPSALGTDTQNFLAGAGKAATDLGLFGKQVATLAGNTLGLTSPEDVDAVMLEAQQKRQEDKELMGTKAGIAGNVAGNIATLVAGGGALRGAGAAAQAVGGTGRVAQTVQAAGRGAEAAGKAILAPSSVRQAAAVGALVGAAQPFETGMDVLGNAAVGATAGAAGQKLAQGIGKAVGYATQKIRSGKKMDEAVAEAAKEAGINPSLLSDVQKERFAAKIIEQVKQANIATAKNPEAAARIARAESLDVPITSSQAEKNMAEQIEMNKVLPYSEDLQGLRQQQRQAIDERIQELVASTKAPSGGSEMAAGESQKAGMRAFEGVTKKAVKDAYRKAEEEAGDLPVATDTILKVLKENKGVDGVKPALMKLKDLQAIGVNNSGDLIAMNIPAKDLYKVRTLASALQKSPTTAHIGKLLKTEVDAAFDESGIGQYAEAAALRRAQSMQFDERAIPSKLVGKKGQEDLIGDDKLMKWIVGRDTKELERYKQALVSGNESLLKPVYKASPEARKLGIQSARDLKAGFLSYLRSNAVVKDEVSGTQIVSPESLVNAYKALGGGRMDVAEAKAKAILGPKMADRLKTIVQTSEDVSMVPGAVAKGSARFNEAISRSLFSLLEMVPVAGKYAAKGTEDIAKKTSAAKLAKQATVSQYLPAKRVPGPAAGVAASGALSGFSQRKGE